MLFQVPDLSPFDAAILYWSGLGAPALHVARRLRCSVEDIATAERRLSEMGCPPPTTAFAGLAGYPSSVAWERRTANDLIRQGLSRSPEAPLAFVAGQGALTTGEVRAGVARIAAGLAAAGIGPGDRVAVDATQRLESYLVILAALLSGASVVCITLANGPDPLRAMIEAAPARITFTSAGLMLDGLSAAGRIVQLGPVAQPAPDFEAWLSDCPESLGDALPEVRISPDDVALVVFTSGSTGAPKLVLTPHEAVFRSTEAMQAMFGFGPDDIFASSTDVTAFSAFRSLVTLPFLCGGRVVLPSARGLTQPLALAEDCAAFGVTQLTVVPNILRGMAKMSDRIAPQALTRLRAVFSGAGVLDQGTRDLFFDRFGVPTIDYYAAREFGSALYAYPDSTGTVSSAGGQPMNCLVRLIGGDGASVPPGAIGEVMLHSDGLTLNALAGTRPEWAGWHQTGDLGVMHPDGRLQIVGRLRDVIKGADGSLIFPVEIESRLNGLDWVSEACVLGWAAEGEPERVIAALILKRPVPDYQALARQHVLDLCGQYRTPARVFALDAFPRVSTSKVDKARLRSMLLPALEAPPLSRRSHA